MMWNIKKLSWGNLIAHVSAVPGKFLGIVGQDHSDSKSNQLHVDIF